MTRLSGSNTSRPNRRESAPGMDETCILLVSAEEPDTELIGIMSAVGSVRVVRSLFDVSVPWTEVACVVADLDPVRMDDIGVEQLWALPSPARPPVVLVVDQDAPGIKKVVRRGKNLGVANYFIRPLDPGQLLRTLGPLCQPHGNDSIDLDTRAGMAAAEATFSYIIERVRTGRPLLFADVTADDGLVLDALRRSGISRWLAAVRMHHSPTYRHSLLVTGAAVAFGQSLGVREDDQKRLAHAGLLHDVGKALTPLAILDKPGRLTEEEMAEIQRHPVTGYELLVAQGGFTEDILDCIRHHHEMLDGSGYPDGLKGDAIADLVRIVTIADIFAALIEPRAYKPPLEPERALTIMDNMGDKLDRDLLRVFHQAILHSR